MVLERPSILYLFACGLGYGQFTGRITLPIQSFSLKISTLLTMTTVMTMSGLVTMAGRYAQKKKKLERRKKERNPLIG